MYDKSAPEVPTTERFLPTVMERQACKRHSVPVGVPCFDMPTNVVGFYRPAICNWRAKKSGFNSKISDKSLRITRFAKK